MLRVLALAALLLALTAVIGPRLASSGGGGSNNDPAAASLPAGVSTRGEAATPTTTIAVLPAGGAAAPSTTTTTIIITTTTASLPPVVPATLLPPVSAGPTDGGAVALTLVGTYQGRRSGEGPGLFVDEDVTWRFRVTNVGTKYLWGVYTYLELYGQMACGAHRLAVGQSTDCWAVTTAEPGINQAAAWTTAWTDLRQVAGRVSAGVTVTGG